jgi:hypothetical protein
MGSQPEAEQVVEQTSRGLLTAATDRRGLRIPIQVAILIGYVVLAALSSLAITGSVAWTAVVVIAPIAWAAQWGAMWLTQRGFLDRPWWRRHGFWSSMVLMLIIAVIATLTAGILGSAAATDGWTVLWRWGITVLVTSIAVLSIDYGRDVQEERDVQEQLQDARLHGVGQVIAQRGDVVSRMLAMLQDAVASVAGSSAQASEVITGFAREQVRPLSHELMQALPVVDAPRARSDSTSGWRDVLARITSVPLIRPTLMAIAVTLLFLFTTVETTTAGDPAPGRDANGGAGVTVSFDLASFAVTLFLLVVVFVVTWGTAWVMLRLTRDVVRRVSLGRRVVVMLLTPIVIAMVLAAVIQVAYVVPGFSDELSSNVVDRLWLTAPIVIVAFVILIGRVLLEVITTTRRQLRRSTADLEWENTRVRNALDQERQFFATQLHGPIQSAAAAAALRLQSLETGVEADSLLADVEHDLTVAIHALADGPPERRELRAEMSNLIATWTGVCAVHIDLPESIVEAFDADWVACGTMVDLLVDAVANAAMHGRAKNVWISGTWLADDEVGITVANDGSTELGDGRGLGTALLDESCVRWSRGIIDGAVALSFTIAIADAAIERSAALSIP